MERKHLLAAELNAYSFANYADHLGIGNNRFEMYMPDEVLLLERAEREGWSDSKVAKASDMDRGDVVERRARFRRAVALVDAEDAAASFRVGVRHSIENAVKEGLQDTESVERLVVQICYRASDLAFLLEREGKTVTDYSAALRREPGVEYYDEE